MVQDDLARYPKVKPNFGTALYVPIRVCLQAWLLLGATCTYSPVAFDSRPLYSGLTNALNGTGAVSLGAGLTLRDRQPRGSWGGFKP